MHNKNICSKKLKHAIKELSKNINVCIYEDWGKSHSYYFFLEDTSPVGKCDIYRLKDKVLTTTVDNK